jgi:NAD-dependent histone deacetylase SIR2
MLATLAEEDRLLRLYTQNVDGIDTALEPLKTTIPLNIKGPWPKSIQLHGGLEKMVCQKCGHLEAFDGSLFDGPEPPACKECATKDEVRKAAGLRCHGVGRLRPRMVLYNEFNPDEEAIGAVSAADLKSRPDAVVVVGTSLKVPGIRRLAKELCSVTRGRRGGFTAWINHDPEPVGIEFKDCWDMVIRGDCDEVARLLSLPKWDDKDCGDYILMERGVRKEKSARPEVLLSFKPLTAIKSEGIITPVDSPREQTPTPTAAPAKLKQAPLKFGSATTAPAENEMKAKKKGARKPLPAKPTKASNKITNAFTATKTTTEKTTKSIGRPRKQLADFPNLALIADAKSSPQTRLNDENVRPQTPKSEIADSFSSQETISPISKPRGMEGLIS